METGLEVVLDIWFVFPSFVCAEAACFCCSGWLSLVLIFGSYLLRRFHLLIKSSFVFSDAVAVLSIIGNIRFWVFTKKRSSRMKEI